MLTFNQLRLANAMRLTQFPGHDGYDPWDYNDWMVAVTGEVGELANKLKRKRLGVEVRGKSLPELKDLAEEMADIVIYLDLLAHYFNINLGEAVIAKFNQVSDEIECDIKLFDSSLSC